MTQRVIELYRQWWTDMIFLKQIRKDIGISKRLKGIGSTYWTTSTVPFPMPIIYSIGLWTVFEKYMDLADYIAKPLLHLEAINGHWIRLRKFGVRYTSKDYSTDSILSLPWHDVQGILRWFYFCLFLIVSQWVFPTVYWKVLGYFTSSW